LVRIYKHKVGIQAYSASVKCTDNKENGELVPVSLKYGCMKYRLCGFKREVINRNIKGNIYFKLLHYYRLKLLTRKLYTCISVETSHDIFFYLQ